jgi:hypothetical protein
MPETIHDTEATTRRTAFHPDGGALYQFVREAAQEVCSDAFSDGANLYPGGRGTALFRTARGRWVWRYISQWQGDQGVRWIAATDINGQPFDIGQVDGFLAHYGTEADLTQWRIDIADPLPLA